jgi:hypothetical protein
MSGELLERNRLGEQTSPYLRLHADNPVHWQPWDAAALKAARELDRPILLSVGYSACHWCHVMARESFTDPDTAAIMNRLFVNIKVDCEERPDLDQLYQLAHQLLNRRGGGWPLTAFLTPDQEPIFIGTYFPARGGRGLPPFREVLERAATAYRDQPQAVAEQGQAVSEALTRIGPSAAEALDDYPVRALRAALDSEYDREHGGWGGAPKFPHTDSVAFCLRRAAAGDAGARAMAEATLTAFTTRGLYDQVGGGFFRYCTDAHWTIPHFEKMLYDNGQLLAACADGAALTGRDDLARAAAETAEWARREMGLPGGGFGAALDAESGGGEGGFYLWERSELERALTPEQAAVALRYYDVSRRGNFEGRNHLVRKRSLAEVAGGLGLDETEASRRLQEARATLLAAREARPRPARDDKVLAGWNGLLVSGLARAAVVLERPDLAETAAAAVDFLRERMFRGGRLAAVHTDGAVRQDGFLEDQALVLEGVLALLEARWDDDHLAFAVGLAEALLRDFQDREGGGFFQTPHDGEALIHRLKPGLDQSLPSGNGAAARGLLELGHLLGEPRYLEAAEDTLKAFAGDLREEPRPYGALIHALELWLDPPTQVVVRGEGEAADALWAAASADYRPRVRAYRIPGDARLQGNLAAKAAGAEPVAYICRGTACSSPVRDPGALTEQLEQPS